MSREVTGSAHSERARLLEDSQRRCEQLTADRDALVAMIQDGEAYIAAGAPASVAAEVELARAGLAEVEAQLVAHDAGQRMLRRAIAGEPSLDEARAFLEAQDRAECARLLVDKLGARVPSWLRHCNSHRAECADASARQRRARNRVELRSRRDEVRAQQSGQRRGPPDPDPLITICDQLIVLISALREERIAAKANPQGDGWVPQRQSPLTARVHARLTRKLLSEGSSLAAKHGRTHLLRQSAIDEYLRGIPVPTAAEPQDAWAALQSELGGLN